MNTKFYKIPSNLVFEAQDIIKLGGLRCFTRIEPQLLADALESPHEILSISAELEFSLGMQDILAQCSVKGRLKKRCSRCLAFYTGDFRAEFAETYPLEGQIDIMDMIRQELVLALELKPLCSQSCRGFCQYCGINLNEKQCDCRPPGSSPFEALKNLKKNKEQQDA